ncbi:MAG: MgtC/SapB family protein, partial [Oscillospiraceae bacterium]
MDSLTQLLQEVNIVSVTVRLFLSLLCGGILGIERGRKKRPAGFRTHMLVCLGSTLVMITSQYVLQTYGQTDITRMGAQVVSGIGFLGAGTIMVTGRNQVKGLTTAAGLWAVACLGLALGIGFYSGAIISCILILFVMTILHKLDGYMVSKSKLINLFIEFSTVRDLATLMNTAKSVNMKVSDIEITKSNSADKAVIVLLTVRTSEVRNHEDVIH